LGQCNVVDQYVSQVESKLNCPREVKQDFLAKLREDIQLAVDREGGNILLLESEFGTPEEIAESYAVNLEQEEMDKAVKKARFWRLFWIIVSVAALLGLGIAVFVLSKNTQRTTQYYDEGMGVLENELNSLVSPVTGG